MADVLSRPPFSQPSFVRRVAHMRVAPAPFSSRDLEARASRGDAFFQQVLSQPKIRIIGSDDALGF